MLMVVVQDKEMISIDKDSSSRWSEPKRAGVDQSSGASHVE